MIDQSGNSASKVTTFRVVDERPPDIVGNNINLQLDEAGNAEISVNDINNGTTDNCRIESVELDRTSFDCLMLGENQVVLTATDIYGNTSSDSFIVTVTGNPPMTWYRDNDNDGYGDPDDFVDTCVQPAGFIAEAGDCNDSDNTINPLGEEIPNDDIDQDCNGEDLTIVSLDDDLNNPEEIVLSTRPNPFYNSTTLRINSVQPRRMHLQIIDTQGRIIEHRQLNLDKINNEISIGATLGNGVYMILLNDQQLGKREA